MKAHNIILKFVPSGMCEINIHKKKLRKPEGKQVLRFDEGLLQDLAWGRAPPVITRSIIILCFSYMFA
jgi:hypothetical protein